MTIERAVTGKVDSSRSDPQQERFAKALQEVFGVLTKYGMTDIPPGAELTGGSTKETHFGLFTYNYDTYTLLTKNKEEIHLTRTEHSVLRTLAINLGKVVKSKTLIEVMYEDEYIKNTAGLVKKYIQTLRKKLGDTKDEKGNYRHIITRHGIGYMLVDRPFVLAGNVSMLYSPD